MVRLSGPGVAAFLARRFTRPAAVRRAVHGLLLDEDGHTIDDPVVVLVDDHTADVSLHGGPWVVRAVLDLAERDGFAVGPVDVDGPANWWPDVMAALPTAATPAAVRMLLAQPAAWAAVDARGDPAERRAIAADHSGWWLTHPPTVAVVGPANVGKSTLANQLFGQERSITADAPGTTRDWVGELADVGGLAVVLVDTPGVRATDDPIEAEAIRGGVRRAAGADAIVLVLDASRPLDADAAAMVAAHPGAIRVANKADVATAWADAGAVPTVATTGVGVDSVRAAIRRRFGCEGIDPTRAQWWTEQQRAALANTGV